MQSKTRARLSPAPRVFCYFSFKCLYRDVPRKKLHAVSLLPQVMKCVTSLGSTNAVHVSFSILQSGEAFPIQRPHASIRNPSSSSRSSIMMREIQFAIHSLSRAASTRSMILATPQSSLLAVIYRQAARTSGAAFAIATL